MKWKTFFIVFEGLSFDKNDNRESNVKLNIYWVSETPISPISHILNHLIIWNISNINLTPNSCLPLQIFMGLANQTLAKLKEVEDIIFILWRGLAVFKLCDSWEWTLNNPIKPCYYDYQVENTFLSYFWLPCMNFNFQKISDVWLYKNKDD